MLKLEAELLYAPLWSLVCTINNDTTAVWYFTTSGGLRVLKGRVCDLTLVNNAPVRPYDRARKRESDEDATISMGFYCGKSHLPR